VPTLLIIRAYEALPAAMKENRKSEAAMERLGRLIVLTLVVAGVVFGGIALAAPGNSGQDKPGKGCGDKNHTHYRVDECKKHH
jgi:hypothetical protein